MVAVIALCVGGWLGWRWLKHDPREYPNFDDTVTVGFGSLENDILPRYNVALPCDTTDVHYADDESPIGSDGTLYLSFTTSARCLRMFISGFGDDFQPPEQLKGGDVRFPDGMRQQRFGWTYQGSTMYDIYAGDIDSSNSATVVVDPAADPVVVRMQVDHF